MRVVSITHGEDPDGLSCAAMLRHLKDVEVIMANYDNFKEILSKLTPPIDEVFITDLNIREALLDELIRINDFTQVTIIDHHPMKDRVYEKLLAMGIRLIYDTRDCAGCLLYDHFRDHLPVEASKLAAYAAISDMFEEGPIASSILARLDRKLAQHQALILTHGMQHNSSMDFRKKILEGMYQFEYPHRIEGASDEAIGYLEEACQIMETIPDEAVRLERLAYMECKGEDSTGSIANLILDTLGVDVGLCYKRNGDYFNISLRGERNLDEHLGNIAQDLAKKNDGFGGGHKRASGAKIPRENMETFIKDLAHRLEK